MDRSTLAIVLTIFILSAIGTYLFAGTLWKQTIIEFEEHDEVILRIDESGHTIGRVRIELPSSPFSAFMQYVVRMMGQEAFEKDLAGSLRSCLARFGFETENIQLETMLGENFRVDISWVSPYATRWTGEDWELTFAWSDPDAAAKEMMAEQELSWVTISSVAKMYGFDVAHFWQRYLMEVSLPASAENVVCDAPKGLVNVDYGGGSYAESSVSLVQTDDSITVIENSLFFMNTQNELTLTPEELAENTLFYTICYSAPPPTNQTFFDSIERIRLDLKYGLELRENYPIFTDDGMRVLTLAQLLYNSVLAVLAENEGLEFSVVSPQVLWPENEAGEWDTAWKQISREEYLDVARVVAEEVASTAAIPSSIETPTGNIRPRDALYLFLRILRELRRGGELPASITIAPVPSGVLRWGVYEVPAKHSYFLLSDLYVITETPRVFEILDNLGDLSGRELAEEICNWVGSNLIPWFSFRPPTSEEVLSSRRGQCRDYTNVYLALARTAGLPSRRVTGWVISAWVPPTGWEFARTTTPTGETVALHAWAQVYLPEEGWIPVEPQSKRPNLHVGSLPYQPYRQLEQTWMNALAGYESAGGIL
jgi:transglutaminase-like putative cysteine protease